MGEGKAQLKLKVSSQVTGPGEKKGRPIVDEGREEGSEGHSSLVAVVGEFQVKRRNF